MLLDKPTLVKFWLYYMIGHLKYFDTVLENNHTTKSARLSDYGRYTSHTNLPEAMIQREYSVRGDEVGDEAVWKALGKYVTNPYICPLMADSLGGLPKALIITVGFDVLRDDGFFYAKRLGESGNDVTHMHYADTVHGAFSIPGLFVGEQMNDYVISYIKQNL